MASMSALSELSAQQQTFVLEWLTDFNGTRSYAAAYANVSVKAAESGAARLLVKAKVQAAVQEQMAIRAQAAQITAERVLKELAAVGFSNIADLMSFTKDGPRLKPQNEIPEAAQRAVSGIKVRHEYGDDEDTPPADVIEFKFWPKIEALKSLVQCLGMVPEKDGGLAQAQNVTINYLLLESRDELERFDADSTGPHVNGTNGTPNGKPPILPPPT